MKRCRVTESENWVFGYFCTINNAYVDIKFKIKWRILKHMTTKDNQIFVSDNQREIDLLKYLESSGRIIWIFIVQFSDAEFLIFIFQISKKNYFIWSLQDQR